MYRPKYIRKNILMLPFGLVAEQKLVLAVWGFGSCQASLGSFNPMLKNIITRNSFIKRL